MTSVARRIAAIAALAGAGLATIAGPATAAHAATNVAVAHHLTPTFTFRDLEGQVQTVTGPVATLTADTAYEWTYTYCFTEHSGLIKRIDSVLLASTDQTNTLSVRQDISVALGPNVCSTSQVDFRASAQGSFSLDGVNSTLTAAPAQSGQLLDYRFANYAGISAPSEQVSVGVLGQDISF
jgi:hypothetical protein